MLFLVMSCYHPLVCRMSKYRNSKGKYDIKIVNKDRFQDELFSPVNHMWNYIAIPCGKCSGCKKDRARDWMLRCLLEQYTSTTCYFLTLTYDDEHLGDPNLDRSDLMSFIKALRNHQSYYYGIDNIRYFGCGEYGSLGRKHFHLILYNSKIDDLELYKSVNGNFLYTSKYISSIWEKGYVVIGSGEANSFMYVAQYIFKKQKKNQDTREYDFEPEFVCCSNHPGIGYQYLHDHLEDIFRDNGIQVFINHESKFFPPPKYFYKICLSDGIDVDKVDRVREFWIDKMRLKMDNDLILNRNMRDKARQDEILSEASFNKRGSL